MANFWEGIEDNYDKIPEQKYPVKVIDCSFLYTTSGEEFMKIVFQIQNEKYMSKYVSDTIFYHTEGSKKRAMYVFNRLGLEHVIKEGRKPEPKELLGCSCIIDLIYKKNDKTGKEYPQPSGWGYHKSNEGNVKVEKKENNPFKETPPTSVTTGLGTPPDFGEPPF